MRIVMAAAEIAPYVDTTGLGTDVAALSASLAARGHEVHVVTPLPSPEIAEAHSLARRLRPIKVSGRDRDRSFVRFDGRTSAGVEVHLLDSAEPNTDHDYDFWDAFGAAAVEVIDSLGSAGTWCVSWNVECASVPVRDREAAETAESHLFVVHRIDDSDLDRIDQALAAEDRALIAGRATADACRSRGFAALERMMVRGHACSTTTPVAAAGKVHRSDKASAKAALQATIGLPVRRDVPLVLFGEPPPTAITEALKRFLRGDVQAVVPLGGDPSIAGLLERYPDRLAQLPMDDPSSSDLLAADGCVVIIDPTLAARAMSHGAIPVTTADAAEGVVDLEPSLSSGSGFIAADGTARGLAEALSRLASSFQSGEPFAGLAERVPSYTTTWSDAAALCEQLIGVTTDETPS
ncbi:MAG: glycogen/starch synthase [Deltaproteobacteria bacterium]|nr:glycogen/starch synthase [Deltaproteobacteria bacterium]